MHIIFDLPASLAILKRNEYENVCKWEQHGYGQGQDAYLSILPHFQKKTPTVQIN